VRRTHTFQIANTRRYAQFSLGKINLTRGAELASGFWKIIFLRAAGLVCFHEDHYIRLRCPKNMPNRSWAHPFASLLRCLLALGFPAFAGIAAGTNAPFIVDSWSVEDGLPDNEIISVIQARDGYLWLGTLHGLVRFDGVRFTPFDEMNTPGLNSDRIVYLFEDRQTNLWVGTEAAGVDRIHDGVIKHFDTENVPGGGQVIYAHEDSTGDIWFTTASQTFFCYHDGKMDFYPGIAAPKLQIQAAGMLAPARDMMVLSRSGGFWQIFNGIVQKWRGNRLEKNYGPVPWGNLRITAACEDPDGNLIVGTLGAGIFWYEPDGQYWHITTEQGLSSVYVLSLCVDRQGDLWVGTDGGGLDRIRRQVFTTPAGLHPWAAQSVSEDAKGGLWIAFGALGATYWNTNATQDYQVGPLHDAWEVLVDRQQQVWAGTHGEGLFRLDGNRFVPAPGAAALGPQILALFEDRAGTLWTGTQRGLAKQEGDNWKLFTPHDGLSGNSVRAIAEDSRGGLWVGTENNGLDYFSDGKFVIYRAGTNSLPGDDISCLYLDPGGTLWVGTVGHGLALRQNGRWKSFSTADGLASDSISYITEDDAGCLWIGSNAGLMRIPKGSLVDFSGGATNAVFCRTYSQADGLPTRECSAGSQPAICRTADGQLWFPTIKGLVSVNPADLKSNLQPPQVMIESILVDGRELKTNRLESAWPPSITIPPGGEELEIHYTALNFSAPEWVRFKTWLEGHEAKPTAVGSERVARYPKLPPGHYTFHVEACNEDNVWSSHDTAMLSVIIQPYFWQTWPFRAAMIVFILGVVAAIVRYVSTQKLQRQLLAHQQREALEKERARIARDLHDQLGANLTQIALLGEMAEADKEAPAEIESHAQQIAQTARETTRSLDEIVWAVNPANDTLDGLVNYAGKYAQEYFALAGLRCRAALPAQLPAVPIPPEVRHNVFLAFKEAVNNVVKHAQASEARIRLRLEPKQFILEVEDNGRGVRNLDSKPNRNGLRNMKKRMEDIRGEFSLGPAPERGTLVRLTVPINSK
jgi:ligand-binding sensor domain-containing protein/signal transduction histidine kinase